MHRGMHTVDVTRTFYSIEAISSYVNLLTSEHTLSTIGYCDAGSSSSQTCSSARVAAVQGLRFPCLSRVILTVSAHQHIIKVSRALSYYIIVRIYLHVTR